MLPPLIRTALRYAKIRAEIQTDFELSAESIRALRELDYIDQWKLAYESNWFHIQFEDLSLVTFNLTDKPSFQFMECPLLVPTLSEFLDAGGLEVRDRHNYRVQDEYQMCIATAPLKENVTPIRYDYDCGAYRAGIHPAAHIHIGNDSEIRIGLQRMMTPLAFFLFIIRQRYPENWGLLLHSSLQRTIGHHVRDELPEVHGSYWSSLDTKELYLY